jgi:S-formylglutathione hydrolase FrmB
LCLARAPRVHGNRRVPVPGASFVSVAGVFAPRRFRRRAPAWTALAVAGAATVLVGTTLATRPSHAAEAVAPSTSSRAASIADTPVAPTTGAPAPLHSTVTVLHVASADNDVPVRDVYVYRPAVADSSRLPVVYFLHGLPGTAADFFNEGGAQRLDRLFASGGAPFVLASPTGTGSDGSDTEWADSTDGRDQVETYVMDRVIPAVEGSHPRDAAHRVIAGFSMGGYGAADLALRHDDVFGGAASFEGYFHIDDPDDVFGHDPAVEAANDPGLLLQRAHDVRFLLADGTSDTEPVTQGEVPRFARLVAQNHGVSRVLIAPGTHSWSFVMNHLDALATFVDSVGTSR